jgi:hypothetical protein
MFGKLCQCSVRQVRDSPEAKFSPSAQIRFPGHFLGSLRPNFTGKWIGFRENLQETPYVIGKAMVSPDFPKETNPFGRNVIAQACRSKTWTPLYGHHPIQAAPGQGNLCQTQTHNQ